MKHENILPLLGVGIGVCVDGRPIGYPVAISPWMDEGHLYDYLKAHSDTSHRMRITYVSSKLDNVSRTNFISLDKMRDIADALTYSTSAAINKCSRSKLLTFNLVHNRKPTVIHGDLKSVSVNSFYFL